MYFLMLLCGLKDGLGWELVDLPSNVPEVWELVDLLSSFACGIYAGKALGEQSL